MKYLNKTILLLISILIIGEIMSQTNKTVDEAKGLQIGTQAPLFNAIDSDNISYSLEKAIMQGSVVIIFYRGFWCPICNKHLSDLQDSLYFIEEKGAQVIALSPEKPEYLKIMEEQTGAGFILLYDEDYKVSDAYDVTFNPTKTQLLTYNVALGAKLKKTHSDKSQQLPIPATYIISKTGKIIWRQFNSNYKKRSTVKDILAALDNYKPGDE